MGLAPNFGLKWDSNIRRGRMITMSKISSKIPRKALSLREQSLSVHGGKLYNLLPRDLRDYNGDKEGFKVILDDFLQNIPDQPMCEGLHPAPINTVTNRNSNSVIDWIIHLNMRDRRKREHENYDSL